jgi:hypothetical protein
MSQLLIWSQSELDQLTAKSVGEKAKQIMNIILPKIYPYDPKIDYQKHECTVCGMKTDGFPCGSEECPN